MRFLIAVFGIILPTLLFGQSINLSSETAAFSQDLSKQFEKNLGLGAKPELAVFNEQYSSKLNEDAKKEVIGVFQLLTKKGLKHIDIWPLVKTYNALFVEPQMDNNALGFFSQSLKKTLEPQNGKKIAEILNTLLIFTTKKQIYNSNYSRIYALNANYRFDFYDKKTNVFSKPTTVPEAKQEDIGWGESNNTEEYDPWTDSKLETHQNQNYASIPNIEGMVIDFKSIDLALAGPSDSLVIHKSLGVFDIINNVFVGDSGTIEWEISDQKINAALSKYAFKVQGSKLIVDNVLLNYEEKLKSPILGVLEIKLENRPKGTKSTFPRFKSYQNNADLILKLKDYQYQGGFMLVGSKISSSSLDGGYAKLSVKTNLGNTFDLISRNFDISDSLISSERCSFVTRFGKDSVSHPAVKLRYNLANNYLHLNKIDRGGYRNSMYSDTFHQVDIKSDAMLWKIDLNKMDFYIISGKSEIPAVFESFNYYNPDRVRYLSTVNGFNPLITAGNIVSKKKINSITLEEMQAATNKEKYQVANGMLIGHQMGFFDYNQSKNIYSISRKGMHYFNSYLGKTDFDDLVLSSVSGGEGNASIDLSTKSLDIKGTQDFKLSDSLGISFIPKGQSMQIVGNKIFTFNGQINVKNYKFYGDFEVQYEKFLVVLKRIDSIKFTPLEIFRRGGTLELGSNIVFGKSGLLYLNSPSNKSGRKNLAEYPKLEIESGALVYFNEKGRKDSFENEVNFKIPKINLDSLNSVNPVFSGIFNSGGIFKPIQENLLVMPDSTLGLKHKPKTPLSIYGTESTIKSDNDIVLNHDGISTAGEFTHYASKLKTQKIKFYTDHLVANGPSGKITESNLPSYFPEVLINEYDLMWRPEIDSLGINSLKGFNFYGGSSQLIGGLIIKKTGLFGHGTLDRADSETKSELYKFNKNGYLADKSDFLVKSTDRKAALAGKFVNIDFNVTTNIVKISPEKSDFNNNEKSILDFPNIDYITTIDKAIWNIKDKKITMAGVVENSNFKSTATKQYGLNFNGAAATYDIANVNLKISGVPSIHSVDVSIIPHNGLVTVKSDGLLEPFTKAKIIADTINGYHVLTNANININSKLSFSGQADYQFVNVKSDTFNIKLGNFEFAEIAANGEILSSKASNKLSTIAKAKVTEKDGIYLSPKMLYRGYITMMAPFKNLTLNGEVIPDLKKYPMLAGSWINYTGSKSEEISINIDESLKDGGKPMFVGLHLKYGQVTDAMYPTFLQSKKSEDDLDIFVANGLFKRDEPAKKFVVKPTDANQQPIAYEFYDEKGIIAMQGKFNLLGAPTQIFETAGIVNLKLDSMQYKFNTMMKFEFPLSIPSVQKMGQDIVKSNLDAGNTDAAIQPDAPYFMAKLAQFVGLKETDEYRTKNLKEHLPLYKLSNKFLNTLVLSDVNLAWNAKANAFYSVGKIGISNIGDVDINAMVDGFVEVVKSPLTGDEINVYLEIAPNVWYYFGYRDGTLSLTSTDVDFNKMIVSPTTGKEKKSDVSFVDEADALRFKKKFLKLYRGQIEPEISKKPTPKPVEKTEATKKDSNPKTVEKTDPSLKPTDPKAVDKKVIPNPETPKPKTPVKKEDDGF